MTQFFLIGCDQMTDKAHFQKLEEIYAAAPCNDYFAPKLKVSEGSAQVTITIRPDFLHAGGVAHGSVYFKAMDDAAAFAVGSLLPDMRILTSSFTIYFMRPVAGGHIKATGRVVHQSKRQFIAEAEVVDADGRSVARGSGIFMRVNNSAKAETAYSK
jgi:uncharacterized protein (TIGR00369 family)